MDYGQYIKQGAQTMPKNEHGKNDERKRAPIFMLFLFFIK
jgi:hypothetical protein